MECELHKHPFHGKTVMAAGLNQNNQTNERWSEERQAKKPSKEEEKLSEIPTDTEDGRI